MNSKFVDYCDQAESIRDTCSRDPAHYKLDVLRYVLVVFFLKRNQKGTRTEKKERKNTEKAIFTRGNQGFDPCSDRGSYEKEVMKIFKTAEVYKFLHS